MPRTVIVRAPLAAALLSAVTLLLAAAHCPAQPRRQGPPPSAITAEVDAVAYPGEDAADSRIDVQARVAYADLIFMRSGRRSPDSAYAARVTLSVDILGEAGAVLASSTDAAELWTADFSATEAPDSFLLLRRSVSVRAPAAAAVTGGAVTARIEIADGNAPRSTRVLRRLRLPAWNAPRPRIASLIPVDVDSAGRPLRASGFGPALLYGRPTWVAVTCAAADGAAWTFELRRRVDGEEFTADALPGGGERPGMGNDPGARDAAPAEDDEDFRTVARAVLQPVALASDLDGDTASGVVPAFGFRRLARPRAGVLALFRLPFDTLLPGRYQLRVLLRRGPDADTLALPVRVLWRDMPAILRHPDRAAAAMRYVLTRAQIEELDDCDEEQVLPWIRAFWKSQDPTPGTEYNERMAEYFRRADEAEERFSTLFYPRGALTDRGRIYILYGEPDGIERVLAPEQPTEEIWTYEDLGRRFRFVDRERSGNLKLSE